MSTARPLAQLSKICLYSNRSTPGIYTRFFSTTAAVAARGPNAQKILSKADKGLRKASSNPQKNKKKGEEVKKKKKTRTTYKQYDQKDLDQFSLLEAMR
jgi:large subunit ribosomal protein L1